MCAKTFSKPLPYRVCGNSYPINRVAKQLREELRPLMQRRLPTVYFSGFKHGHIISLIKKYKQSYRYFLKLDIKKYYPSVPHHTIIMQAQLAYKDLLAKRAVPKTFKQKYLPSIVAFTEQQPAHYGIPLGNRMSSVLAPLVFVPMLLHLKKQGVPFIVFADDILVFATSKKETQSLYIYIMQELSAIGLEINTAKMSSGKIANVPFTFCGWAIQGGYYGVCKSKVNAFKTKLSCQCQTKKALPLRAQLKKINQILCGFGHYYKYGNVSKLFTTLDSFIRQQLRTWMKQQNLPYLKNAALSAMGLKSLSGLLKGTTNPIPKAKKIINTLVKTQSKTHTELPLLADLLEFQQTLVNQNKEIIAQLKKLNLALQL